MNYSSIFPQSSKHLPCSLIPLQNWRLIKIQGIDAIQYSQGQLTCDLNSLQTNQYTLAAHCNPKGKIINNMYVFHSDSEIALIERYNICNKQINEMKKYAIFSKVKIYLDNHITLFGVAGINAKKILNEHFNILPDARITMIHTTDVVILYFPLPQERFLFIIPNIIKKNIIKTLSQNMQISNSMQWTALDIEAGYPIISNETSEKLIPQEANMHLLNGISLNKGCYLGQETIARTQYKKINKRGLYLLIGNYTNHLPKPGNKLEIKTNKNTWRETGLILASCVTNTKKIWIQAVLHHSVANNIPLRIINDKENILKIFPLPYNEH